MKVSWIVILCVIFCCPIITYALNCAPLDPRGKITKEEERVISGRVEGLFKKLLNVGGEFQRNVKETVDNLHGQLPKTESQVIKEKVIYLYCEALNEAKMEQRITLINSLQNNLNLPITGASEDMGGGHGFIRAIGYASISWQCEATDKPCPPRAELKRRAIKVAEITAAAALGRQRETKMQEQTRIEQGKPIRESIESTIAIILKGIQYDLPLENGDEILIHARIPLQLN